MTFDGRDAAQRLVEAVLMEIENLPDFDAGFRQRVRDQIEARRSTHDSELTQITKQLDKVGERIHNVTDPIADAGLNGALQRKLATLLTEQDELKVKLVQRQAIELGYR
jgi:hypothetical protein